MVRLSLSTIIRIIIYVLLLILAHFYNLFVLKEVLIAIGLVFFIPLAIWYKYRNNEISPYFSNDGTICSYTTYSWMYALYLAAKHPLSAVVFALFNAFYILPDVEESSRLFYSANFAVFILLALCLKFEQQLRIESKHQFIVPALILSALSIGVIDSLALFVWYGKTVHWLISVTGY